MKKDHINYFAVGSFVLAMLVLLISSLLYISGQGGATHTYYVSYTNISGIHNGTTVTYGGYKIGTIERVEPIRDEAKTRYRVSLNIRSDWAIPDDSLAQIVSPSILAEKTIEIHEGKSKTMLSPGDDIRGLAAIDMMAMMNHLSAEFEELANGDIRPLINKFSHYLNDIGEDLNHNIPEITRNTSALLISLNESATGLNELINNENRQHLHSLFKNANEMSKSLIVLTRQLNTTGEKVDHLLNRSNKMLDENSSDIRQAVIDMRKSLEILSQNMNSIVHNMNASARNMNEFTRELRRNPSVIISSKPPVENKE